jgi:hypothetical protein
MMPASPDAWKAVSSAYAAVQDFDPDTQLTATAWAVVAVLAGLRERARNHDTPEAKASFDTTCGATLAWIQREIEQLRFTKTQ